MTGGIDRSVAHAPQAAAMFDREMRYIAASPRWMSDYALTPPIAGLSHYDLFPDIGERWKAVHRRCLAGATERSEGERFERPDGGEPWIRWEVRPWRDESGATRRRRHHHRDHRRARRRGAGAIRVRQG